jgi:thiol-disulfide isomerase/thioredoxin
MLLEFLFMRLLYIILLLIGIADRGLAQPAQLSAFAKGDLAKLSFAKAGSLPPPATFEGKSGTTSLAAFKGKVLLVNLWATWCAPCLKEMPQLDRLAGMMKGSDIVVLTVSQDQAGWRAVDPWWSKAQLKNLTPYVDKKMALGFGLGAQGLPITIIYNRQGREVARLNGVAAWDSVNAQALLRAVR